MKSAEVGNGPIEVLRGFEASLQTEPERLFQLGERVSLTEAPFAAIEGVFKWLGVSAESWCFGP